MLASGWASVARSCGWRLARMVSGHTRLIDALRRAGAAGRLLEPGASGEWSARDVFAPVVRYQRWIAVQLGAPLRPMTPGPPGASPVLP